MKNTFITAVLFFVSSHALFSQEVEGKEKQDKNPVVGIAMNLSTFNLIEYEASGLIPPGQSVSVLFNLGNDFRMEAEIAGMLTPLNDETYLFYGLGLFFKNSKDKINALYGVRIGRIEFEGETGLYFTPAIGGEYNFSRRFSLGGEIQFRTTLYGDEPTVVINAPVSLRFYL